MKLLSAELLDAIDGGDECRGRDSQLTEWANMATRLEDALKLWHDYAVDVLAWDIDDFMVKSAAEALGLPPK